MTLSGKTPPAATTADHLFEAAVRILDEAQTLPELVVIDLDYTLWPGYCECMDGRRDPPVYPGAIPILRALQSKGVRLAVASKSPATAQAKMFLRRLQIIEMFESIQVYSYPHKEPHFKAIKQETGVAYARIMFFDDEFPNIKTIGAMGVTCVYVPDNGLDLEALGSGLRLHASQKEGKAALQAAGVRRAPGPGR